MRLLRVVCVRHGPLGILFLGRPLRRTAWAFDKHPLVAEQVVEVSVRPFRRRRSPRAFEATGDRVDAFSFAEAVLPAEALFVEARSLGFGADVLIGVGRSVRFAERVPASDEGHRLFVVHRHSPESGANILRSGERIGVSVGAFGIDVDQAHLGRTERLFEFSITGVTLVVHPLGFRAPVNVRIGFPCIHATAGESEGLEARRFERTVAGEDHEVRPRESPAVFLLDRQEQPTGLVEVRVIGPTAHRCEAKDTRCCAAATVGDAVCSRAVPRHADEQPRVGAVVGGPPVLRRRHQGHDVLLDGCEVEFLELLCVVVILAHRIAFG